MKKIYGLAALAAAMTLASCSNNDEPNKVDAGSANFSKAYFAVNINPTKDNTRANAGETIADEYKVKDVQFIVFDEDGKYLAITNKYEDFTWATNSDSNIDANSTNSKENGNAKVIEIDRDDTLGDAGYVMCILNSPLTSTETNSFTAGETTLDEVRKLVGDYKKSGNFFVMTNSAYEEDDEVQYATNFTGHIYKTYLAAEADPVNIYVERVAARVDLTDEDNNCANTTVTGYTVDGSAKSLNVEIDGVDFIYSTSKSYLVKDIETCKNNSSIASWFTGSNRTHWADDIDWTNVAGGKPSDYYNKTYFTSARENDVVDEDTQNFYINENVSSNKTYVVITGKIKVAGNSNYVTLYQLAQGGQFYTLDGAKTQTCYLLANCADHFQYYNNTDGTITKGSVNQDDIDFVAGTNECAGYLQVNESKVIDGVTCKLCKGTELVAGASNGKITFDATWAANVWKDGNTYYYTEINPEVATGINMKGVIRNHLYKIEFSELKGLGCPLFEPSKELIPRTPIPVNGEDPKWFFNAKINILSWAVNSQNMGFSNGPGKD